MSELSIATKFLVAFAPLVITVFAGWLVIWRMGDPQRMLAFIVRHMPEARREWGMAMLAEFDQVQGTLARWSYGLSCARVAMFPPNVFGWPRYWLAAFRTIGPKCGALSVALPPIGVPLIFVAAFAAQNFTSHDHFFNGELVPGLVGAFIVVSISCILSGIPLGIAGLFRRERFCVLSVAGPAWSIVIFGYLQLVQHLAAN